MIYSKELASANWVLLYTTQQRKSREIFIFSAIFVRGILNRCNRTLWGGICLSLNGTLKALSDPIRRNILTMLKGKKMIAGEIAEELGFSPESI